MKRSEMIKELNYFISENTDMIGVEAILPNSDQIIKFLENKGMSPPKVITLDLGNCHRFECKWEPED